MQACRSDLDLRRQSRPEMKMRGMKAAGLGFMGHRCVEEAAYPISARVFEHGLSHYIRTRNEVSWLNRSDI